MAFSSEVVHHCDIIGGEISAYVCFDQPVSANNE